MGIYDIFRGWVQIFSILIEYSHIPICTVRTVLFSVIVPLVHTDFLKKKTFIMKIQLNQASSLKCFNDNF